MGKKEAKKQGPFSGSPHTKCYWGSGFRGYATLECIYIRSPVYGNP